MRSSGEGTHHQFGCLIKHLRAWDICWEFKAPTSYWWGKKRTTKTPYNTILVAAMDMVLSKQVPAWQSIVQQELDRRKEYSDRLQTKANKHVDWSMAVAHGALGNAYPRWPLIFQEYWMDLERDEESGRVVHLEEVLASEKPLLFDRSQVKEVLGAAWEELPHVGYYDMGVFRLEDDSYGYLLTEHFDSDDVYEARSRSHRVVKNLKSDSIAELLDQIPESYLNLMGFDELKRLGLAFTNRGRRE